MWQYNSSPFFSAPTMGLSEIYNHALTRLMFSNSLKFLPRVDLLFASFSRNNTSDGAAIGGSSRIRDGGYSYDGEVIGDRVGFVLQTCFSLLVSV